MTGPHDPTERGAEPELRYEPSRIEPPDVDEAALAVLDARGRSAAAGLQAHVRAHVGPLAEAPPSSGAARPWRSRVLAAAAVAALVAGLVATQGIDGDDQARLDVDADELPELQAGLLTPLGPRDGKDSIRLPITAAPSTGLRDGDVVTVTGEGFEPGESVGIVQCAKEAAGDAPEDRAGVEACNIGAYSPVTADDEGRIAGTFTVRRVLTTPLTGTVDCAAEAERCIVAAGAIADYDRSGGTPLAFDPDVAPVPIPTIVVEPATDLADGQAVRVVADGLTPNEVIYVQVCASDPTACWSTGRWVEVGASPGPYAAVAHTELGLRTDAEGRIDEQIPVWRYLPGGPPGTYVDCAVSRCSLRFGGTTVPPSVPLAFRGDEPPPQAPLLGVEPSTDLAPGDAVVVAGRGFPVGTEVWLELCVSPAERPMVGHDGPCLVLDDRDPVARVDEDGSFARRFEIPDLSQLGSTVESCDDAGECWAMDASTVGCDDAGECWAVGASDVRCDGVAYRCEVVATAFDQFETGEAGVPAPPPVFGSTAVSVTLRS